MTRPVERFVRVTVEPIALGWIAIVLLAAIVGGIATGPTRPNLSAILEAPSSSHMLGTDALGRDMLLRLIYSARPTVTVSLAAAAIATAIGVSVGMFAATSSVWVNRMIVIVVDAGWAIPFTVLAMLPLSFLGTNELTVAMTIGCLNWVGVARVARLAATSATRAPHAIAARAFGYRRAKATVLALLPTMRGVMPPLIAFAVVEAITLESGLSFLGLGVPPPRPTWGGLLAEGLAYVSSAAWLAVTAGAAIVLTLASLQVLAHRLSHLAR